MTRVGTLSTFVEDTLGRKRKAEVVEIGEPDAYGKRPQVAVSIRADFPVSPDTERKIEPIIKSEIRSWFESGKAVHALGFPEHEIIVHIDEEAQREGTALAPWGGEVVKKDVTVTALGPFVKHDIEVETGMEVKTAPQDSPESQGYTRTRTWRTTTRETTTSVKQETRTEIEMLVPERPEVTSNLYVYGSEPQPLEEIGVTVRSKAVLESTPDSLSQIERTGAGKIERDMQQANENICRRLEESLGASPKP